uniref:Uncharacterized protein n=1 Tax=Vespula pensylvanica TaxID=30213 RepID=A0A834P9P9_VESPE|nr:hypothetical protein H0235_002129 [Vespula pensylvanica]
MEEVGVVDDYTTSNERKLGFRWDAKANERAGVVKVVAAATAAAAAAAVMVEEKNLGRRSRVIFKFDKTPEVAYSVAKPTARWRGIEKLPGIQSKPGEYGWKEGWEEAERGGGGGDGGGGGGGFESVAGAISAATVNPQQIGACHLNARAVVGGKASSVTGQTNL